MFKIEIETHNAAFEEAGTATETGRILREVAKRLLKGDLEGSVRDANGNTVGSYALNSLRPAPAPGPESVADFARRFGIKMEAQQIPARPDNATGWMKAARHWLCTFKRGAVMPVAFLFSQGPAHDRPPTCEEVLNWLAIAAASYLNSRNVDDLALEVGIESPGDANRLWQALAQTVEKLEALLGRRADVEALAFHTKRL